jgi:hypothetical protein
LKHYITYFLKAVNSSFTKKFLIIALLTIFTTQFSNADITSKLSQSKEPRKCVKCSDILKVATHYFQKDSVYTATSLKDEINKSFELNLSEDNMELIIKNCIWSLHPLYVDEAVGVNDLYCLLMEQKLNRNEIMDSLDQWLMEFDFYNAELWPYIDSTDIVDNLKLNLSNPDTINQGLETNLCAYSAITRYLIEKNPKSYVSLVTSLYTKGEGIYDNKLLTASPEIRYNAGRVDYDGISENKADQMLLLVLAQNYQKSFINIFPGRYKLGDECKANWAGTAIQQFDRMIRTLGYNTKTKGADLFPGKNYIDSIKVQSDRGEDLFVLVNGALLKKRKLFKNLSANHFIQMRSIIPEQLSGDGKMRYSIVIWDYGHWKIYSGITRRNFNAFTYAYTRILNN